jgi:beta-glucanase (GH16 family)
VQWARQAFAAPLDRSRLVLSFEDHFAHGPDPKIWSDPEAPDSVAGRSIKENKELELYVDPQMRGTGPAALNLKSVTASDQGLEISARRIPADALPYTWGYKYMSGRLNSRASLAQTYGYFEARAKVPSGDGLWPAFWMLPARGGWPPEIDIFEVLGRDPSVVYHSIHTGVWSKPNHFTHKYQTDDLSKDYHTYGVWWDRDVIRFYLDDTFVTQYDTPRQLNQPCYLIINLAVGGWGGPPDPAADQLGVMKVAWVKAYHFAR